MPIQNGASGTPGRPALPGRNLLEAKAEAFRPPAFTVVRSRRQRLILAARHLLDPAAASVWRDLSLLLPSSEGAVLDVGCGAQPYRGLVPAAARYHGIDRVESLAAFSYHNPDTTYYEGDRWPVEDQSADWILCSEVLEHVREPQAFLAEALRCLKPGGRLVLTVPFAARWHYIPFDYQRYTPSGLGVLLTQSGFVDATVHARGNPLTVACYKFLALPILLLTVSRGWARLPGLLLGAALAPLGLLAGLLAYATLGWDFGDDCIGYTVLASKPL